jgi:hypothetical protein
LIRYLTHEEIEKEKWDSAVSASPGGNVCAASWFLDTASPGWEALVDDNYENVFPLTWRKKWGLRYLYQPPFVQQLGLFGLDAGRTNAVSEFLLAIPDKFRLIEIQLNYLNRPADAEGFTAAKGITHHLPLKEQVSSMRADYSSNLTRNLKKGMAHKLSVNENLEVRELIALFRLNRGKDISGLRESDYGVLERLLNEANARGLLSTLGIQGDSGLMAGAAFLESFSSYIFIFSAVNKEAREKGAMSHLIDHFIGKHSGSEKFLDFEGSLDPSLARFYKSFGSQEVVYLQLRKNNLPLPFRWFK